MDDIRWFAAYDFGALPVAPLRASGLRIATEGSRPARLIMTTSGWLAPDGYAASRRDSAPLILYLWDLPPWQLAGGRPNLVLPVGGRLVKVPRLWGAYPERNGYYSRLRYVATHAAEVWVPSANSQGEVRNFFQIDAAEVPFCFDSDRFNRGAGWAPPQQPVVLSISRLVEYKNHAAVLRAIALVPSRPPVRIIGQGPEARRLRALAAELGVVLQLDEVFLPPAAILEAYRTASVVVCPSRFEGIGVTPLESVAIGVPTVASDIPAHREFANGELTLVQLDDDAAMAAAIEAALRVRTAAPSEPRHPIPALTIEACAARMLPRFEALLRGR